MSQKIRSQPRAGPKRRMESDRSVTYAECNGPAGLERQLTEEARQIKEQTEQIHEKNTESLIRSNSIRYQADAILITAVQQIWNEYDADNNGWLDKNEMRLFVIDILYNQKLGKQYNEPDFEKVFQQFDTDGDGRISKIEMLNFLKQFNA